jgi:hypothetical protein
VPVRAIAVVAVLFALAPSALADDEPRADAGVAPADAAPADAAPEPSLVQTIMAKPPIDRPIVGFRVRGDSKLTERTLGWIAHVDLGEMISDDKIPEIEAALMSSELFKSAVVTLEPTEGGVLVVATLDDKMSWIAAPLREVTTPMRFGNRGSGRFFSGANMPSAASFCFS